MSAVAVALRMRHVLPGVRAALRVWLAVLLGAGPGCESPGRVETTLRQHPDKFSRVMADPCEYRLQLLISTVERGPDGRPRLHRDGFRVNAEYFYPASAIKLCAAVGAMETLARLEREHGVTIPFDAPLRIAPLFPGDREQAGDESNVEGGQITVEHEVRKLFLVSDNRAFNRLYDLVGQRDLNELMHRAGLSTVVINHRLSDPRPIPDSQASAAVTILTGSVPIEIPARASDLALRNEGSGLLVGRGYMSGEAQVPRPMDFAARNGANLVDLQNALVMVVRPEIDLGLPGFPLAPAQREVLLRAMSQYPGESANPRYDAAEFPDSYCKFLLPGLLRVGPRERWRIFNKVGQAYGFTIENAYVEDLERGVGVFVAAAIYTNADGVLNDDRYEYAAIAEPFMADLGEVLARELMDQPVAP